MHGDFFSPTYCGESANALFFFYDRPTHYCGSASTLSVQSKTNRKKMNYSKIRIKTLLNEGKKPCVQQSEPAVTKDLYYVAMLMQVCDWSTWS